MPEDGIKLTPPSSLLSANEVVKLTSLFITQGVTKIRLTGGEPLVRKDIVDIVGMEKLISACIAMCCFLSTVWCRLVGI